MRRRKKVLKRFLFFRVLFWFFVKHNHALMNPRPWYQDDVRYRLICSQCSAVYDAKIIPTA